MPAIYRGHFFVRKALPANVQFPPNGELCRHFLNNKP